MKTFKTLHVVGSHSSWPSPCRAQQVFTRIVSRKDTLSRKGNALVSPLHSHFQRNNLLQCLYASYKRAASLFTVTLRSSYWLPRSINIFRCLGCRLDSILPGLWTFKPIDLSLFRTFSSSL